MKRRLVFPLVFVSVLLNVFHSMGQQKFSPLKYALVNCTTIDPASETRMENAVIHVASGKIEAVESGATPQDDYEVYDLEGMYVMPGMIDAHTHVSDRQGAEIALKSGVTTVRSASTSSYQDIGLRALVNGGAIPGPDVLATGVFVTPDLGESILADPRLANLAGGVNTPDELKYLVDVNADRGVDFIKTRGTERAGLPDTDPRKQTYTQAQLKAIVDAAAARDIPVMVHAHGDEGAAAAVLAGARSIEHGTFMSRETLRLMLERDVYFVPTYITLVDLVEPGGDYDDPVIHMRGKYMLPHSEKAIKTAIELGVKLVTGADNRYTLESTSRVSMEAEHFVRLGLPNWDGLKATTSYAAELLGIAASTGQIKPGYEADLIVLPDDPTQDIRALQDVVMVISNGHPAVNRLPFGIQEK